MIRPGIGIYGCYENKKLEKKIKNVINLKGKIIQIKIYKKINMLDIIEHIKQKQKQKLQ